MATIDIGPGAIDRSSTYSIGSLTTIDLNNPANGDGIITDVEIYLIKTDNIKVAIFEPLGGLLYKTRSCVSLGSVAGGKQTFTGLNLAVKTGDFIGIYGGGPGSIESDTTGHVSTASVFGDKTGVGTEFNVTGLQSGDAISIYGYGADPITFTPVITQF